jgi:hypothetical protein
MKRISRKTVCLTGLETFEKIDDQADDAEGHHEKPFPLKKIRYNLEHTFHW